MSTSGFGATDVGMPFLAVFAAVRVSYPYGTCVESTATSNSSPYYFFRIRGGRGDALYKSTVDIDIDIDIFRFTSTPEVVLYLRNGTR